MDYGGRIMSIVVTTEKQFESDIESFSYQVKVNFGQKVTEV